MAKSDLCYRKIALVSWGHMDWARRKNEKSPVGKKAIAVANLPPLGYHLRGHGLLRAMKTKQKLVELASS